MVAEVASHLPLFQRTVEHGFLHFILPVSGYDSPKPNEASSLKVKMQKLFKDILPYRLWAREIPEDLVFLNERNEKFFNSPPTGTPIRSLGGTASVFLKWNHLVLKTFGASKNSLGS